MAEDEKVRLRNANIVAGDPGMNPLLFMVDSPYPTQKVVTKREYRRVQRRIRPPNQRLHPRGKSSRKYKNRNYRKNRRRRDAALAAAAAAYQSSRVLRPAIVMSLVDNGLEPPPQLTHLLRRGFRHRANAPAACSPARRRSRGAGPRREWHPRWGWDGTALAKLWIPAHR